MNPRKTAFARSRALQWAVAGFSVVALSLPAVAQQKRNPTSKVYVSDVSGEALIDTGEAVEDLSKRSVYYAQGAVIETRRPQGQDDRSKNYSTMVYSNGTGAFFDADTRVEVKRFVQEPFTPNRTDMDVEPSVSQTQAFVARGAVGLCTSKLVAGSNMTYVTPHGNVNIRGRKIVIEAENDVTKISMLEGDSTVRGGPQDLGGQTIKAGEQAIIRRNPNGGPSIVQIDRIPPAELPKLDEKVTMACMAKRTVYFEERELSLGGRGAAGSDSTAAGAAPSGASAEGGAPITAFDGNSGASSVTIREIIPIEVVPVNLPVEFTVSPASILTPARAVTPGQAVSPGPGT